MKKFFGSWQSGTRIKWPCTEVFRAPPLDLKSKLPEPRESMKGRCRRRALPGNGNLPPEFSTPIKRMIGVENYVVFPAQTCLSLAMESAQGACL